MQRYGDAFAAELPAEGLLHVLMHGEERFRLGPGENVAGRDPSEAAGRGISTPPKRIRFPSASRTAWR